MAVYSNAIDLNDPTFDSTEEHCLAADDYVISKLWEREINPVDVILPSKLLTRIAGYWAKREGAIEGAIGEDSPLLRKAKEFQINADELAKTISKRSLGIETKSTFGTIKIGRS